MHTGISGSVQLAKSPTDTSVIFWADQDHTPWSRRTAKATAYKPSRSRWLPQLPYSTSIACRAFSSENLKLSSTRRPVQLNQTVDDRLRSRQTSRATSTAVAQGDNTTTSVQTTTADKHLTSHQSVRRPKVCERTTPPFRGSSSETNVKGSEFGLFFLPHFRGIALLT